MRVFDAPDGPATAVEALPAGEAVAAAAAKTARTAPMLDAAAGTEAATATAAASMSASAGPTSRLHTGRCIPNTDDPDRAAGAGAGRRVQWQLPVEQPVAIRINGMSLAVMMATPADLGDMAWGFLLAEGYFDDSASFGTPRVTATAQGVCVDIDADERAMRDRRPRALEGRTGCGLCGVQELDGVMRALPHRVRAPLAAAAVELAFAGMDAAQPIRAANRSVHGAAFATADGTVRLVREDVGRHNALDKLVGALDRARVDPGSGFAVMTSRCSFELVQKAALAGLAGLATVSAPTTLAVDIARGAGLPLGFRAGDGVVFLDL